MPRIGLLLERHARPSDYFACGRRVPAFFNGLVLGITALGGAGFLALTGSFFIIGFDALCLSIGFYAGLVFMGVLFAPFLRKVGAYTVPTLPRPPLREPHACASWRRQCCPCRSCCCWRPRPGLPPTPAAWLARPVGAPDGVLVVACAAGIVIAGGMRSLTWSSVGQAIAALLALAVPATIVALMVSNLPLPQMTHGNVLRVLTRVEMARNGCRSCWRRRWRSSLPGAGVETLTKRFVQAFGSVGSLSFVLMSFVAAAGIAASPTLLPRSGTTPGVYEARKSCGWAVLVSGVVLLTLPAIAVYLRSLLLEQVVGQPATACRCGSSCCSRPASPASRQRRRRCGCRHRLRARRGAVCAVRLPPAFRR